MKDDYSGKSYSGGSNDDCFDWFASHDHRPPGPKMLHVKGKCKFRTGGYSVELKPAYPPGLNPKIYLLDKIVHKPSGPADDSLTTVEVRYDEQTDTEYDQVEIRPDGVTLDVEHTQ